MPGIGDHTQTSFGYDGWDPPEGHGEFSNDGGGGGGGFGPTDKGPARFKVPEPDENPLERGKPARKRFMIVGAPFYMWEHGTYKMQNIPRGVYSPLCLKENKIADRCPMCEDKRWPSYGAYFTVVDMGFVRYASGGAELIGENWVDDRGKSHDMQFRRRLMVAKRGGKENPGTLAFFEDQRNRRGDLTGCVYDTQRTGRKKASMGDNIEFVERAGTVVPPTVEEMRAYLQSHGASDEALKWAKEVTVFDHLNKVEVKIEETLFTRITPIRMMPLLYSMDEMDRWVGNAPRVAPGATDGERTLTTGAGYQDDDNVPF
jgi:hypothetical protein